MVKRVKSLFSWLLNLFDPPPLKSMTLTQKAGRVLFLTGTLVLGSIIVAMLGAVGLFLMEKGREFRDAPEFIDGLGIIFVGVVVNSVCVLVLVQIKHADHKLISPEGAAIAKAEMLGQGAKSSSGSSPAAPESTAGK
jgi:hypothetical protein